MKAILFSCLLFISNLSFAENVGYEVELIVFEDTSELYKNSENWPLETKDSNENSEPEKTENKPETVDKNKKIDFVFIDSENYRLNKQAEKLQQNSRYKVLYHKAWKQPGLDKKSAVAVSINTENTATADDENPTTKPESFITGDFTLIMSRYLHVVSNLILYKPAKPIANTVSNVTNENENTDIEQKTTNKAYEQYPLIFERRMRSKEIHYIDHPLGGMIVLATPYKIETETKEDKSAKGYKTL